MKKIYLFGGLGVDKEVFHDLNFERYEKKVILWIVPEKSESLESYCRRLLPQIDSDNSILVGVSFGGIVALQVADLINVKHVFLISSVRSYHEIPWYIRLVGILRIQKMAPWRILRKMNFIFRWAFTLNDPKHRKMLTSIINHTSPEYLKWAISCILYWKGEYSPENTIQIHGDKDRTFPIHYIKHPDRTVNGAGHFMIVQRAAEIAAIIDNTVL